MEKPTLSMSSWKIIRICIGIIFLIIVGWIFLPPLFNTYGLNAVINAPLVKLVTPIDGTIELSKDFRGAEFKKGDLLANVSNKTIDRSNLENMQIEKSSLQERIRALRKEINKLTSIKSDLVKSAQQYQSSILERTRIALEKAKVNHHGAMANLGNSVVTLQRESHLYKKGAGPKKNFDTASFDSQEKQSVVDAARAEIEKLEAEHKSIKSGVIVNNDGRTEILYQNQRIDEINIRVSDIHSKLDEYVIRLIAVNRQIAIEEERIKHLSSAQIIAPTDGVLWRSMVSSSGHAVAKTPVIEIADCSKLFADITISERLYEKIKPGSSVTLRLIGSNTDLHGRVIGVRGGALAPDMETSFAGFTPIRKQREIQVMVSIDQKSMSTTKADFCNIGRNAEVKFLDL